MPLWRLIPVDLNHPKWATSEHKGEVIVRAPTEAEARELTDRAFGIWARHVPGAPIPLSPWPDPSLVSCEQSGDDRFPSDGPNEVLDPKPRG